MEKTDLKPCPFCGESVSIEQEWADSRSAYYSFICNNCGMHCEQNERMTKEEAIEVWNGRVSDV